MNPDCSVWIRLQILSRNLHLRTRINKLKAQGLQRPCVFCPLGCEHEVNIKNQGGSHRKNVNIKENVASTLKNVYDKSEIGNMRS